MRWRAAILSQLSGCNCLKAGKSVALMKVRLSIYPPMGIIPPPALKNSNSKFMKSSFTRTPSKRPAHGFTLVELLVVITIIVVLASVSFTGYNYAMSKVHMSKTMENMRQLATGTLLYSQDHSGYIPRGDEGADGAGLGGRGIIWINHIAPNIGFPELETQLLNKPVDGMDQWTYLLTKYKSAPFVCAALKGDELAKTKKATIDAIGGIGYNTSPLATSKLGAGPNNASWGAPSAPIPFASITHPTSRCMYASSYDWHLANTGARSYSRFGKDKSAMVFWDGSCRLVTRLEYDRAINTPDLSLSRGK